jgi:dUTP pyrophosphatase
MIDVKILKLSDEAKFNGYQREGDSGVDLSSIEDKIVKSKSRCLVKTGIAIEIPLGYEAQVRPRSGLALKNGITVLNTPGTIDSGYRGEIGVIVFNSSEEDFIVKKGDRIAQLVVCPIINANFIFVEELSKTKRSDGGFGSTGV